MIAWGKLKENKNGMLEVDDWVRAGGADEEKTNESTGNQT